MNKPIDWIIAAALVVTLLTIWGLAGTADYEEAVRQQQQYCDMLGIWEKTGGEYGWPPYKGDDQC